MRRPPEMFTTRSGLRCLLSKTTKVRVKSACWQTSMLMHRSGQNFFDGWDFFYWQDPTNGMVNYQGSGDAWAKGIVSITQKGTAVMRTDNWSWLAQGAYRDSIRITSKQTFKKGQMMVLDAVHMPYGCATWPAFWAVGANWPYGGEMDIVEGVNNQWSNQMTLHTAPGCDQSGTWGQAGKILQGSCDAFYNSNTGCGVQDPSGASYGQGFNKNGGGVFATLWNNDGISVYFFQRGNIPADLHQQKPNPAGWGQPRAFFRNMDACQLDKFFGDQTIVFDTTLCGDWAGATYGSNGCPGSCADRITNPSNFNEAYWEVNYVRIYG